MARTPTIQQLTALSDFFQSGETLPYAFRRRQLINLKQAILKYEQRFYEAFYQDLHKSKEESWVTELGFVIAEINEALRELKRWMAPARAGTNLLNFPSVSRVVREPLGVVFIIGPWNYPFQLVIAPLVSAIAAGNCAVIKTGESAVATDNLLREMIADTFAENYIAYAQGEGAQVVPELMNQFRFDHVFFTGGTAAGKAVYQRAAEKLVPVTLELGGKSPAIVEADADIPVTARRIASTKFSNAGQMCVAVDYILVHHTRKEELLHELLKCIRAFYGDNPELSDNYGRMINIRQFDRVISYFAQGTIAHGGKHERNSLYIEPTILTDVSWNDPVMREEIFGPVLPVISFTDEEGWKPLTDHHPNPLAAYIFTSSKQKQQQWMQQLRFGGGCINNASWHLTNPELPFGGRGWSGTGRYHGRYGFETFSHPKAILKTPTWFDPKIKYPPLTGRLSLFKKFIK